jgi:hypothetical protein
MNIPPSCCRLCKVKLELNMNVRDESYTMKGSYRASNRRLEVTVGYYNTIINTFSHIILEYYI